jgi:hypothetical protein
MICPLGSQPPAGLSVTRWLAALRVYLVVLLLISLVIFEHRPPDPRIYLEFVPWNLGASGYRLFRFSSPATKSNVHT